MLSYVVRRLLYSIVVLFAASFLVFTFVSVSGDPLAALRVTPDYDPNTIKRIEEQNNLDKPIPVRYVYWLQDAVRGDFGKTLLGDRPIGPDLWRVMKNTLQLVFIAELFAVLIAVMIGVYSALRQYSAFDYATTAFSFLGLAMPVFWLALMLQVLVVNVYEATGHRIFPIANLSSIDPGNGIDFWIDRAHHLVLPVIVLMVASIAKGLNERSVTFKHAFRNALIPLVTLVALNFGTLLGGVIVTETVFSLDGMGLYFVTNLLTNDPYPVMAWLMVTAVMIIIFNLLADIAYGVLDPRVRYE
jgi:ABC-type dipeptide/oligopeptide/nickel transport system permease component